MPRSKSSLHRNGEEWRADRLLLNKEVMMSAPVKRFLPLLDEVARDFCRMLQAKVEKEGGDKEGKRSLTMDPSPDLFRFALEGRRSSSPVICNLCLFCVYSHVWLHSNEFLFYSQKATKSCLFFYPEKVS